ncbi:MGDG synthase family glycosyltransferase [Calidifontibacillus erzurumensis]|uniref:UDP-glucuronosyltransferase n=1 Tax=Calidifontibacillus erzurumensis TaxID=2741433 RepID=A0A8J8GES4_9BACI|nr:glycosyltransferase [Calidifontibacillus erzurumensis]NSL51078.1 UDP-glucuronosyltransferase [Calidifontibacillus erzurumensis]
MSKSSKTILFLPFLQIPSGHHHAANALIDGIKRTLPNVQCEKVDILSYSYGKIERFVSNIYLKWIKLFPNFYNLIYQNSVYRRLDQDKRFRLYEYLFLHFMKKLILAKNPDLVICTHALPSYMMNCLKKRKEVSVPVINVYTDYFIHSFWGIDHIDFHFVSCEEMKRLLKKKGIHDNRIFMTGIPIHEKIEKKIEPFLGSTKEKSQFEVLVAGGNLGVGALDFFIQSIEKQSADEEIRYYVLCGKNPKLYEKLKMKNNNRIIPLPYIDCRVKMNKLYDQIDAVVTKPGGVTISECLFKRKPIFIYDALPGQEQINLQQLKSLGLVFQLTNNNIQKQIVTTLKNEDAMKQYFKNLERFHAQLHQEEPSKLILKILTNFRKSPTYRE